MADVTMYHYDFVVTGLSEQVADMLMELIICFVNASNGFVAGGYRDVESEAATEDTQRDC